MYSFDIILHIYVQGKPCGSPHHTAVSPNKQYWSDCVKIQPDNRAVLLGRFIIENKATVRCAAKKFGISKSTVHKDVSERLCKIDPELSGKVKEILEINKRERHIRGGMATKLKYRRLAEKNTRPA